MHLSADFRNRPDQSLPGESPERLFVGPRLSATPPGRRQHACQTTTQLAPRGPGPPASRTPRLPKGPDAIVKRRTVGQPVSKMSEVSEDGQAI